MNALAIVQIVNALLNLTTQFNISWQALATSIAEAEAEGREFNIDDVKTLQSEADKAISGLESAVGNPESD